MLLEGLHLPLTTPFYPDGRLNLRKLEHNVAAYSKTPVAGFALLSQYGEPSMLSDEETLQVLGTAIEVAAAEKVMLAGASRDSVLGTLDRVEHAAKLGYDAVLVEQPSFFRVGNGSSRTKELLNYFQSVADRAAIPVVLCSSVNVLPAEVVLELAGHPQIIGLVEGNAVPERIALLKEATSAVKHEVAVTSIFAAVTGRMLARQKTASSGGMVSVDTLIGGGAVLSAVPPVPALKTRMKIVGFQILAGGTSTMLEALLAGAVGAMPGFAACAPQACYEVLAAWKDEDRGLAEEKQARLLVAASRLEGELGVAAIKFGCDLNGYFGGLPRLPLLPPSGEVRQEIESLLLGLRN